MTALRNSAMELNHFIDHTLLKPDATEGQIRQLCQEALDYRFASVCVNPCHVPLCAELLAGSAVKVCTVIGFPLGASATAVKAFEAATAVQQGAREVDMVLNIGALKDGKAGLVKSDVAAVVSAANGAAVKVILEACLLTDAEKQEACRLLSDTGIAFVKTSTGFSSGGATVHDVSLMKQAAGPHVAVKASGGIRDRATALAMIEAGATRLGTSAGIKIVTE